jgi:hypothetical protein
MSSPAKETRILSLSAVLFIVQLLSSPFLTDRAYAVESGACAIKESEAPAQPLHFRAKVQGMAAPEEVRRQTHIAELRTGGAVSPDYLGYPRILAVFIAGGVAHSTIAAVVDGHIPQPGENVELASRYRDPRSACNFIPWTVVPAPTI